jgi:hypothetical protein
LGRKGTNLPKHALLVGGFCSTHNLSNTPAPRAVDLDALRDPGAISPVRVFFVRTKLVAATVAKPSGTGTVHGSRVTDFPWEVTVRAIESRRIKGPLKMPVAAA